MKRLSAVAAGLGLALMWSLPVQAQTGWGAYLGLSMANVTTDPATSTDSSSGFILGGHYDYDFGETLTLEPSLQIAQRGFSITALSSAVSGGLTITYLELPILAKVKIPTDHAVTPFIEIGPNLGVKMGASCSVSGASSCTVDSSQIATVDFGLDFGVGINFGLEGGSVISATFRYFLGLSNIASAASGTGTMKNDGLALLAGYDF